jgi:hypothetical protein
LATDSGYSDQKKTRKGQHVTVSQIREQQYGYDVRAHLYVQEVATDAAEADSTTTTIVATAHAAIPGDIILFTTGNLAKSEYTVAETETNAVVVAEVMREAPAAADAFKILRFKHPKVNSDGDITVSAASGPIAFNLDGSQEEVTEDTGTPANNIPLPVKLVNASGDIIGQEAMAASIPVVIASDQSPVDVAQSGTWDIGDVTGTVSLPTGAATEATLAGILADTGAIETDTAQIAADTGTIAGDTTAIAADTTAIATDTGTIATSTTAIAVDTGTIAADTTSIDGKMVQLALDQGAVSGAVRTTDAKANIAYTGSGEIAGASLTGSYATLLNPTTDLRVLYLLNDCNNTIFVSLDGGSTDSFKLKAGEGLSVDLGANGLKFDNAVNISAKHAGAAPTSGSIRASGIG